MNQNTNAVFHSPERIWNCLGNQFHWAYYNLGIELHDNQLQIIEAVCDPSIKDLAVLGARGSGKTIAVCCGLARWCIDNPNMQIGVFAPKEDQATRLIEEIVKMAGSKTGLLFNAIDWDKSTKSRLFFKNGSYIIGLSGAEETMQEGFHFNIVVLDEAHQLTDSAVNSRITPMLGSLRVGKTIKIGIPMYKNHFWKSCNDGSTVVIKHNWLQCDIFLNTGDTFFYEGKEYPRYIVSKIPLSVKQNLFPNRPDLHTEGQMTELEYKIQYNVEWAEDINLELSEDDKKRLTDSHHQVLSAGGNEDYYWGLDTAQGGGQKDGADRDYTALAIWRKRADGTKEKVAGFEWRELDQPTQLEEIKQIIHPSTGLFKCKFGLADSSNWGSYMVSELKKIGIPADGVMFGSSDPRTKKNYKNAMFDHFKVELQNGRVKYPSMIVINQQRVVKKAYNEWTNIERYQTGGLNSKISAPSGLHDDHVSADILCVYAMDFMDLFSDGWGSRVVLPRPIIIPGGFGSSFFNPQFRNPPSKYL